MKKSTVKFSIKFQTSNHFIPTLYLPYSSTS